MGCVVSRRKIHDSCTVHLDCVNNDYDSCQKCANYTICKEMVPKDTKGLQNPFLCMMCDKMLGQLLIRKPQTKSECCICLEDSQAFEVKMDCGHEHWVCQDCFAKPLQTDCLVFTKKTTMILLLRLGWKKTFQLVSFMPPISRKQQEIIRVRLESLLRCPLCRGKSPWGRMVNHDSDELNIASILDYQNKKMMLHLLLLYREVTDAKISCNETRSTDVEMQTIWSIS